MESRSIVVIAALTCLLVSCLLVTTFVTIHYGFFCFPHGRSPSTRSRVQEQDASEDERRAVSEEEPPLIVTRPLRFFVQGERAPLPSAVNAHVPLPCRAPIWVEANRNNHTGPVVLDPACLRVLQDAPEAQTLPLDNLLIPRAMPVMQ
jgi:hypothetical protein